MEKITKLIIHKQGVQIKGGGLKNWILLYKYLVKIFKNIEGFKEMDRNKLTSLIGAILGLIAVILNIAFGVTIPETINLTITGLLVSLIFLFWKPDNKKEENITSYKKQFMNKQTKEK